MDPCVPNPCKNAGTCQSHLQRIRDLNYHIGPQFHGSDENVITVVGPTTRNETYHHPSHFDESTNEMSYQPDFRVTTHNVNHFHMTPDDPNKVYEVWKECILFTLREANSRKLDAAEYSIFENSRKFILVKNRCFQFVKDNSHFFPPLDTFSLLKTLYHCI